MKFSFSFMSHASTKSFFCILDLGLWCYSCINIYSSVLKVRFLYSMHILYIIYIYTRTVIEYTGMFVGNFDHKEWWQRRNLSERPEIDAKTCTVQYYIPIKCLNIYYVLNRVNCTIIFFLYRNTKQGSSIWHERRSNLNT